MKKQTIDSCKILKQRDPDMVAAESAMKRAAAKAWQKAQQVGASVAVWQDGRIIEQRIEKASTQ